MLSRRGFLAGLTAALAAPAIIRTPGLLMPVKSIVAPEPEHLMLIDPAGGVVWRSGLGRSINAVGTKVDLLTLMVNVASGTSGPGYSFKASANVRKAADRQLRDKASPLASTLDRYAGAGLTTIRGIPLVS